VKNFDVVRAFNEFRNREVIAPLTSWQTNDFVGSDKSVAFGRREPTNLVVISFFACDFNGVWECKGGATDLMANHVDTTPMPGPLASSGSGSK
jgi:hypothetical protein